jgi:hypothetical protein
MKMRNACNILIGKPEIKNSLGRHREDNIKINLVVESVGWIYPAQNRVRWRSLVNTVLDILVL